MIKATFKLMKETAGALRYEEINARGIVLEMKEAAIGTLYLRKTNFTDGKFPSEIEVTVTHATDDIAL